MLFEFTGAGFFIVVVPLKVIIPVDLDQLVHRVLESLELTAKFLPGPPRWLDTRLLPVLLNGSLHLNDGLLQLIDGLAHGLHFTF
jgi:hypothetical protein